MRHVHSSIENKIVCSGEDGHSRGHYRASPGVQGLGEGMNESEYEHTFMALLCGWRTHRRSGRNAYLAVTDAEVNRLGSIQTKEVHLFSLELKKTTTWKAHLLTFVWIKKKG